MSLADQLAGKKVLVTGVTGFVGEALLHRILGDLPGTTVVAIIRPKGSLSGTARMAQMLKKDIFQPFYGEGTPYADADELTAERVEVVEGDLADVPALPKDLIRYVAREAALYRGLEDIEFAPKSQRHWDADKGEHGRHHGHAQPGVLPSQASIILQQEAATLFLLHGHDHTPRGKTGETVPDQIEQGRCRGIRYNLAIAVRDKSHQQITDVGYAGSGCRQSSSQPPAPREPAESQPPGLGKQ